MISDRGKHEKFLFYTCFVALIATSFGFISRAFMLGDWGEAYGFSPTQLGEIFGAGLWPFGISIVLWSLFIDRVGYRRAMVFAFVCHVASALLTIFGTTQDWFGLGPYRWLYIGAFIGGLGNGTIEAVINPVVATMFSKEKTKWLNILHAGWPGGLAIAGVLTILLAGTGMGWEVKVALIFVPTIAYGIMMIFCAFPVSERVAAGVSYRDMLREAGALGALIAGGLIVFELGRVFGVTWGVNAAITIAITIGYWLATHSLGRPMYIFMLLLMLILATTELGTDGWIKELMDPVMAELDLDGGWILVYTATLMVVLRFCTGMILKVFSPLGLLATSAAVATAGLVWLSQIHTAVGITILVAATVYGVGKTFFWPTTLGVISEQFPKGGALTLNAIAGVGMLGVGILGGPWLGYIQNTTIEQTLAQETPELHAQVMGESTRSLFGSYLPVDADKVAALTSNLVEAEELAARLVTEAEAEAGGPMSPAERETLLQANEEHAALISSPQFTEQQEITSSLTELQNQAKKDALFKVAILPLIMFLCYVGLNLYFRSKGGYQAVSLTPAEESG